MPVVRGAAGSWEAVEDAVPYHVRLLVQGESAEEVKLDVDDLTLEHQFLTPGGRGHHDRRSHYPCDAYSSDAHLA